jgi:D-alanine-D-alanine ligase
VPKQTKIKIAVIFGGISTEYDVSVSSGKNVINNLDKNKYEITAVKIQRNGRWSINNHPGLNVKTALLELAGMDIAFIALHGIFGEDGKIQALLGKEGIPFTGSGPAAYAVTINKDISNKKIKSIGQNVPVWGMWSTSKPSYNQLPIVIKPVTGGSSVGVKIIRTRNELKNIVSQPRPKSLMWQKFVPGREMTCGILERGGRPFALAPTEIVPKTSTWFDYKAKYTPGASQEITPARLNRKLIYELQSLALAAHNKLGCRGMSRSDYIFDNKNFWYLETNTIPGLTKTSKIGQIFWL